MKKKNKVALIGISGLLATSLAVGGATFALFKSDVTNGSNNVKAGTLKITEKRDDIPNAGPMFYTENVSGNYGAMPTGLWAPGDKHTRGLFLENTGTLEAKLKTLTVVPADSNGVKVTSGAQYDDNILFARQAKVKIWQIKEYDSTGGVIPFTRMDSTQMDLVMDVINDGYNDWLTANPTADLDDQVTLARFLNSLNALLLERLNNQGNSVDNRHYEVVRMYNQSLINLVNNNFDASNFNIKVAPDQAAFLGFTVEFNKNAPNGVDKNSMQGKSVYFNFGSDWEQTRNN
ncbi:hypothetical protein V7161_29820 [Neobacillus drentensis]|uniref:hypothetical protein n=1 Tax=Neobacillus drentensis TaxID=220684 RepID=UPI003001D593